MSCWVLLEREATELKEDVDHRIMQHPHCLTPQKINTSHHHNLKKRAHLLRVSAQQTQPKFHEKTPRERETQRAKMEARGKKRAKFWAPHPSRPHPSSGQTWCWPAQSLVVAILRLAKKGATSCGMGQTSPDESWQSPWKSWVDSFPNSHTSETISGFLVTHHR